MLQRIGCFRSSVICRKMMYLITLKKRNSFNWCDFKLCIENNNLVLSKKIIKDLYKNKLFFSSMIEEKAVAKEYYRIICKRYPCKFSKKDEEFYDFISKKNIHIWGPLDEKEEFLDSKAVNVIFNSDIVNNHIYADVAYLNHEGFVYLQNNTEFDWNKYRFMIFKNEYSFTKRSFRVIMDTECILVNGNFNMLPIALFDLLRGNPKSIFVSGTNLYCDNKIYSDSYKSFSVNKLLDNKKIIKSISVHDLITQFSFLKNLYELGFFMCDDSLKRVMNMTIETYAAELEKIYVE